MTRLIEKIVLGVILIVLVGVNSLLILGHQERVNVPERTAQLSVPLEISEEQAKSIARETVDGVITEVEEKTFKGVNVYEVEMKSGLSEVEVKIDKRDGDVLEVNWEEESDEDEFFPLEVFFPLEEVQEISGVVSEEEARRIALNLIGGSVVSVEVESEGGRLIYEVEIAAQGDTVEVEVDAKTGDVLEIEWGED